MKKYTEISQNTFRQNKMVSKTVNHVEHTYAAEAGVKT